MGLGDAVRAAKDRLKENVAKPMQSSGGVQGKLMEKMQGKVAEKIGAVIQDLAEVNTEGFLLIADGIEKTNKKLDKVIELLEIIAEK